MPIVALPDGRTVEFPEGATPSLITGALRKDFPQLFGDPERAVRKERLQQQQAEAREEGDSVTWGTGYRAEQAGAFGNLARGVAQVPAGLLKTAGTVADAVRRYAPDDGLRFDVGGDQSALSTAGEWIEQQANRLPTTDPEALDAQFQTGIGQMGGMMTGGGVVGKLAGKAVTRGALAAGASEKAAERLAGRAARAYGQGGAVAAGFGQEFSDAYDRASGLGDDPDTALAKSLGYASVATMIESAAGAGRLFRQYFPSPQQAQQALTKMGVSRAIAGNFLAGYGEEASQRISQNLIVEPGSDPLAGAHEEGRVGALVQGLVGLPAAGRGYRPQTTRLPDGREVVVNQETGGTEFSSQQAASQLSTLNSQPAAAALFRGKNGEDIRVELGGASLEQAQAAIFRQQPGAEFVGVELNKVELPEPQLKETGQTFNSPATPPMPAAPAATAEAATPGLTSAAVESPLKTTGFALSEQALRPLPEVPGAPAPLEGQPYEPTNLEPVSSSLVVEASGETARPPEMMSPAEWAEANLEPAFLKLSKESVIDQQALLQPYVDAIREAVKSGRTISAEAWEAGTRAGWPSKLEEKASRYRWSEGVYSPPPSAQADLGAGAAPPQQKVAPESFGSVEEMLQFRSARIQEEVELYRREIGLSQTQAADLQGLLAREASLKGFEKRVGPALAARMENFFETSPYNKVGGPFQFWDTDRHLNPENVSREADKSLLASTLVGALARGVELKVTSDRFLSAAIASRRLGEAGGTLSDIGRALDAYTTRESGSASDKAWLFKSLGKKVNDFLALQGVNLPSGDLATGLTKAPAAQPGVAPTGAEPPALPGGGQVTVAQTTPSAKPKKVRAGKSLASRFDEETLRVGDDILDFIRESGGMLSKAAAKAKGASSWKLMSPEYDDARPLAVPWHKLIYRGRRTPDKVAQSAFEAGKLREPSVPALWQAISDASRVRRSSAGTASREEAFLKEEAAAAERWAKATESGKFPITAEQLSVGDVLDVEGTQVEVTHRDEETGRLTLQDGREFETQFLEDGQTIYVEAWVEKTPEGSPLKDDWDVELEAPPQRGPAPRKLTKAEGAEYSELEDKRRAAQEGGEALSMAEARRYSELTAAAGQQELLAESGASSTAGRVATLQAKLAEVERLQRMAEKRLYETKQGSNGRNMVMAEVRGYSDAAAQLRAEITGLQSGPPSSESEMDLFAGMPESAAASLLNEGASRAQQAAANRAADEADGFFGNVSANPFLDPRFWKAALVSGARILRDLGQWTATRAQWSAAMVKRFGERIRRALDATWSRLMRLQNQQANGVDAITQGHLNQIEIASGKANVAEEAKPLYSEEQLAMGTPGPGITSQPMSRQIAFFGGKDLLASKQKLDVTGALQAAAVKKQSDNLWEQLVESSAKANPLTQWKLPSWLIGTPRARAFKTRALHIAARLNATGRDASGNFTFADFTMRAGTMSPATAAKAQLSVGATFAVNDPLTGVTETLALGPIITTPEGRVFHQLERKVNAGTQQKLYNHFAREYPEMIWFLDLFIDPALSGVRQTINGIEVPVFNRFAAAAMMAEGNPNFSALTAYTPDVLVTRSLLGSIRGALSFRAGTRSPGRKYKSGTSREGGHVRDLLSGFNVRTWQMLQEQSRREWMQAVLKTATPIKQNQVPKGWVKLETGMEELWQAVKRLRNWNSAMDPATGLPLFPETEQRLKDDQSPEYKAFFLEAMKLRGKHLMLPKALVEQLVRKYVAHVEHGTLRRLGSWLVRNSTQLFLVAPVTVVNNVLTNDLMTLQAATRRILMAVANGRMQDARFARELFTAEFFKWFPGLRTLVDPQWRAAMNDGVLPENLFADQTMLADLKVRLDEDPLSYLRQGEIGAAALQFIRYGSIDVRAKTRMAYAWLRAQAVTNARKAGLRGDAERAAVDAYLANPPVADIAAAVEVAGFELLNYADSPAWLEDAASGRFRWMGSDVDVGDFGRLVFPFPRFGYHFIAKAAREAAAVKVLLGKVPKGQRADAFADLITFLMWPAGGLGLLAAYGLKGLGDDDDEARKRVGTASIKSVDDDGNVVSKPLPRDLITSNRINLSAWARGLGLGTDREEDFWLRVRAYPVIAMAGAALLAEEDARKLGAAEGAATYAGAVKDLAADFFSVGMALKVPAKVLNDLGNTRNERTFLDPYAAGVPTIAYVTDQTLDSFIPGSRQFDLAIKWLDPIARRRAASKTLDFQPGVWHAARVGHVTGLLDRLLAGEDGTTASTLPPEGKIDRRSGTVLVPQEYSLTQRLAELGGFNIRPIDRSRYEEALAPYSATR